jgi:hypothetical protein
MTRFKNSFKDINKSLNKLAFKIIKHH